MLNEGPDEVRADVVLRQAGVWGRHPPPFTGQLKIGLVSEARKGEDGKVEYWVYRYPYQATGRCRFT